MIRVYIKSVASDVPWSEYKEKLLLPGREQLNIVALYLYASTVTENFETGWLKG